MNNVLRNWKTTLAGVAMVMAGAAAIAENPVNALKPETIAALAGGIGLIAGKDGDKSGTARVPR